jgi:uncharacterized protein
VFYVQLFLFGACCGVVSGMLGIGGGVILVPGLMLLFGFTQPEAQGTSLAALCMPILAFAAAVYYKYGHVKLPVTGAVALGIMVGAYVGAQLINYVPQAGLRVAFGGLLLYLGMAFVFGPHLPRTAAALPAGVTLVLVALGAWLRGKRAAVGKIAPPSEEMEYHI